MDLVVKTNERKIVSHLDFYTKVIFTVCILTNRPESQTKDLGRFSILSQMNTCTIHVILGTNAVQY